MSKTVTLEPTAAHSTDYQPKPHLTRPAHTSYSFANARGRRRYWIVLSVMAALSVLSVVGNLAWDNPMPVGSAGFWRIAELRVTNMTVVVVVAFCQSIATVAFHTITNNRIITPSLMGFESLYRLVQTSAVFFFGIAGVTMVSGIWQYLSQVALMVAFAACLYGWLLTGKFRSLHLVLLIGIVLGTALGAIATFMQQMLTPSEFDVLTARLIGSIANSDATYLSVAIPLAAVAGGGIWVLSRKLNVLALGRDTAANLGVDPGKYSIIMLLLVSVLMAVSTSLVGPMSFLGFLVAMISYQLADTFDHRLVFPMAWLTGIFTLAGSYFMLKHIFYAEGSVGIIIEAVGGSFFLLYVLRKGRL